MKKDFEQYITHHTTEALGHVEKTLINSALVSAQNRQRYYWTNFEVTQPDDKGILLRDVIEGEPDIKFNLSNQRIQTIKKSRTGGVFIDPSKKDKTGTLVASYHKIPSDGNYIAQGGVQKDNVVVFRPCELRENSEPADSGLWHVANATDIKGHEQRKRVYSAEGKAPTLQTCGGGGHEPKVLVNDGCTVVQKDNVVVRATVQANAEHTYNGKVPTLTAAMGVGGGNVPLFANNDVAERFKGAYIDKDVRMLYRKLTPLECERLQTFPDGWTDSISNTQRYKSLGNAWTVDVIAHIFKCMQRVE